MNFADLGCMRTRRTFFRDCGTGLGTLALWHLLADGGDAATLPNPLEPKSPHFKPRARNVIFMFMDGGPSQMDLLDPKPEMKKWEGQSLPESLTKDLKLAFIKPTAKVWPSPRGFNRVAQSGMEFSDWLPQMATCADDFCMIRSMHTDQFNHHPGAAHDDLRFAAGWPPVHGSMGLLWARKRIARVCRASW